MSNGITLANGGYPVKTAKSHHLESWEFDALAPVRFSEIASLGAGVVSTAIQARFVLPQACKIPKVAISCTAIDSLAGTDAFNIVVGNGAYDTAIVTPPWDDQNTWGYPTQFATAGQALFAQDVQFTAANFPGYFIQQPDGTVLTIAAAMTTGAGGVGVFVPTVWDAVFPAFTVLTVRAITTASTGSITDLDITLLTAAVDQYPSGPRDGNDGVPSLGW
jgi:hypothetical protein